MNFVVLEKPPFDVVIGCLTIVRIGDVLVFQKSEFSFAVECKKTTLAMIPEHERPKDRGDDTSS